MPLTPEQLERLKKERAAKLTAEAGSPTVGEGRSNASEYLPQGQVTSPQEAVPQMPAAQARRLEALIGTASEPEQASNRATAKPAHSLASSLQTSAFERGDDILGGMGAVSSYLTGQNRDASSAEGMNFTERFKANREVANDLLKQSRGELSSGERLLSDFIGAAAGGPRVVASTALKGAQGLGGIGRLLAMIGAGGVDSFAASTGDQEKDWGENLIDTAMGAGITAIGHPAAHLGNFVGKKIAKSDSAQTIIDKLSGKGKSSEHLSHENLSKTDADTYLEGGTPAIIKAEEAISEANIPPSKGNIDKMETIIDRSRQGIAAEAEKIGTSVRNMEITTQQIDARDLQYRKQSNAVTDNYKRTLNTFAPNKIPRNEVLDLTDKVKPAHIDVNRTDTAGVRRYNDIVDRFHKITNKPSTVMNANGQTVPQEVDPTFAEINALYEELDGMLGTPLEPVSDAVTSQVQGFKKELEQVLNRSSKGAFGSARRAYKANNIPFEAYKLGRQIGDSGTSLDQARKEFDHLVRQSDMSLVDAKILKDADADFKRGLASSMFQKVDKNVSSGLRSIIGDPTDPQKINRQNVKMLEDAFGKEFSDELVDLYTTSGPRVEAYNNLINTLSSKIENPTQRMTRPSKAKDSAYLASRAIASNSMGAPADVNVFRRLVSDDYSTRPPSPAASQGILDLIAGQGDRYSGPMRRTAQRAFLGNALDAGTPYVSPLLATAASGNATEAWNDREN